MLNKRKLTVIVMSAILVCSLSGCTSDKTESSREDSENSIYESSAEQVSNTDEVPTEVAKAAYFENTADFENAAKPSSSITQGDTLLKKTASLITADTTHYQFTEYNLAENMLGINIDVITVEVEKKDNITYSKSVKTINGERTEEEFLNVNGDSLRISSDRKIWSKENPAEDEILLTNSLATISENLSEEGTVEYQGETLQYEKYQYGNSSVIAYFKDGKFIRAEVYKQDPDTNELRYVGYTEGNFEMEIDENLLEFPVGYNG